MSPEASTALPLMASTLCLHHAIHAGDSDGGEQSTDGGGDQADE